MSVIAMFDFLKKCKIIKKEKVTGRSVKKGANTCTLNKKIAKDLSHITEGENFHYLADTQVEPTGENPKRKTREHFSTEMEKRI